ncbi:MAG: type secretion system protein [Actinomycetia bacterium]|nr:type secretion system protein [Actinomycetes bacterium]
MNPGVLPLAAVSPIAIALAAGLVVFLLAFAIATYMGGEKTKIVDRISDYQLDPAYVPDAPPEMQLSESKVVQQAVDLTGSLAGHTRALGATEKLLEQADVPLRAAEALFFYVAGVLILTVVLVLTLHPWTVGLVIAAVVAGVPPVVLKSRRRTRVAQFQEQLPQILSLLAGSLRAGFSFVQGLESVANESMDPMKREMQRVFNEGRLGRPIEDAMDEAADRMDSTDLRWAVMAIRIQREVGGNLAELLDTVADTMTERDRLKREVSALTAEGRISAIVMGIFPFGFAGFLYVIKPEYLNALFSDSTGLMFVIGSSVLAVLGFFWLMNIVKIEI